MSDGDYRYKDSLSGMPHGWKLSIPESHALYADALQDEVKRLRADLAEARVHIQRLIAAHDNGGDDVGRADAFLARPEGK